MQSTSNSNYPDIRSIGTQIILLFTKALNEKRNKADIKLRGCIENNLVMTNEKIANSRAFYQMQPAVTTDKYLLQILTELCNGPKPEESKKIKELMMQALDCVQTSSNTETISNHSNQNNNNSPAAPIQAKRVYGKLEEDEETSDEEYYDEIEDESEDKNEDEYKQPTLAADDIIQLSNLAKEFVVLFQKNENTWVNYVADIRSLFSGKNVVEQSSSKTISTSFAQFIKTLISSSDDDKDKDEDEEEDDDDDKEDDYAFQLALELSTQSLYQKRNLEPQGMESAEINNNELLQKEEDPDLLAAIELSLQPNTSKIDLSEQSAHSQTQGDLQQFRKFSY